MGLELVRFTECEKCETWREFSSFIDGTLPILNIRAIRQTKGIERRE